MAHLDKVYKLRVLEYAGKSQTLSAWAREVGIPMKTLWMRLDLGWDLEQALTQPIRKEYPEEALCKAEGCTKRPRFLGLCRNHYMQHRYRHHAPLLKTQYQKRVAGIKDHRKNLMKSAKKRAAALGLPFNITFEDIVIPEKCPILGMPLVRNVGSMKQDSMTLDRVIPHLGYVKGNVRVISMRANARKNDMTLGMMQMLAEDTRKWILEHNLQEHTDGRLDPPYKDDMTAL